MSYLQKKQHTDKQTIKCVKNCDMRSQPDCLSLPVTCLHSLVGVFSNDVKTFPTAGTKYVNINQLAIIYIYVTNQKLQYFYPMTTEILATRQISDAILDSVLLSKTCFRDEK